MNTILIHKIALAFLLLGIVNISSAQWVQMGFDIDGEYAYDFSGESVSLSSNGNTVAIGASRNNGNGNNSGHLRVFQFNGLDWEQKGTDMDGDDIKDGLGALVSLSSDGNIVAAGALQYNNNGEERGLVRVFDFNGSEWVQLGSAINGEAPDDRSGVLSLNSEGNIVAIGATRNDGNGIGSGHVRVYFYNDTVWSQLGVDIDGEAAGDYSGNSVSISSSGNTVAIGATSNDGNGLSSGHVRIYQYDVNNWVQKGDDIDGEMTQDNSGRSVSLSSDGDIIAIGAAESDGGGYRRGHVRVFQFNGTGWVQIGNDIDGEANNDLSGSSVSLSSNGTRIAIGASNNSDNGSNSGQVRIYHFEGNNWVQIGEDIEGEGIDNYSGHPVSLCSDGNIVAIGASGNNGNNTNSGHVRIFTCNTFSTIDLVECNSLTSPSNNYIWNETGVYYDTLQNATGCDSIITINLTINNNTGVDVQTACDTYIWIDGNTYTESNNIATDTLTNVAGCDSVVTLALTINIVNINVTNTDTSITASDINATYRWLDCSDSLIIFGETEQIYIPINNGNYAVEVTNNSCIDTSECTAITKIGILEILNKNNISIYPNPTQSKITIECVGSEQIQIVDITGKIVKQFSSEKDQLTIDISNQAKGIYLVKVFTEKGIRSQKIVLE